MIISRIKLFHQVLIGYLNFFLKSLNWIAVVQISIAWVMPGCLSVPLLVDVFLLQICLYFEFPSWVIFSTVLSHVCRLSLQALGGQSYNPVLYLFSKTPQRCPHVRSTHLDPTLCWPERQVSCKSGIREGLWIKQWAIHLVNHNELVLPSPWVTLLVGAGGISMEGPNGLTFSSVGWKGLLGTRDPKRAILDFNLNKKLFQCLWAKRSGKWYTILHWTLLLDEQISAYFEPRIHGTLQTLYSSLFLPFLVFFLIHNRCTYFQDTGDDWIHSYNL